jgi:hypothetical protein
MILTSGTSINTGDATAMAVHSLPAFTGTMRPIIQNLGPGNLYLSTSSTSITTRGIKLPVNAVYELPATLVEGAGQVWLGASGDDCDVRIINVG